jgi:hypothetical protein
MLITTKTWTLSIGVYIEGLKPTERCPGIPDIPSASHYITKPNVTRHLTGK